MERKHFALILALALAACTPSGDPPEEPPETESEQTGPEPGEETPDAPEPSEEPAPTQSDLPTQGASPPTESEAPEEPSSPESPAEDPEATGVLLPSCEGLLGPGDLGNYLFEQIDAVELIPPPPNWGPAASHVSDSEVQSVLQQAYAIDSCTWGVPQSDAFFTVVMAVVSPELADQARSDLESAGAPTVHPPLIGYVTEQTDATSVAVHRIEDDAIFSFQGGPGSINADDAQRHGFATILQTVSEATSR